jgi:hypothetical protein
MQYGDPLMMNTAPAVRPRQSESVAAGRVAVSRHNGTRAR